MDAHAFDGVDIDWWETTNTMDNEKK
jgi:hypothetical protein